MKKFLAGIKQGLGFLSVLVVGGAIVIYAVNAWSGTDNLTAGAGDKLTATKLNQILAKINSGGGSSSGINYDSTNNYNSFSGGILAGNSTTCDSTTKGELRNTSSALQICDGSSWSDLRSFALGTSSNPATSCSAILSNNASSANGVYRINVNSTPEQVYCDMTNGGRTLVSRIIATQDHLNISRLGGTIQGDGQSNVWKLSDTEINSIPKSVGYKLTCAGVSYTFSNSCVFGSTSLAAGSCNPGGGNTVVNGVSVRPNTSPMIIYGYTAGGLGCYNGTARGQAGTLRVK